MRRRRPRLGRRSPEVIESEARMPIVRPNTISQMCDACQMWADDYYRLPGPDGQRVPTREANNLKDAMRALRAVAGDRPIEELSVDHLAMAQEWMVDQGLGRRTINDRINRLRRVCRWAAKAPRRWLPREAIAELVLIDPLRWGRTDAPDKPPVPPVSHEAFTDTMAAIPPQWPHLYRMLDLHWLTGMRPGELVRMERDDFATERATLATGAEIEVTVYRPKQHKTRHHGLDRHIFLGPEAKRIIDDWMRVCSEQQLWPYTTNSYGHAIRKINQQNGLLQWSPNQIRHAYATRMRATAGIDVVQVLMGHRHRATTEIYALPDCSAAIEAIFRLG